MAAIDYLIQKGFAAKIQGKRIVVSPASRLTDDVRVYIKAHRLELIAELAANDGIERCCHWQVTLCGKPICIMIGEPMTEAEALEAARWRWPGTEVNHG